MALTNWANGDLFSALRDKFNAVITFLTGGTSGQIPISNGSGDPTWTTVGLPPSTSGNGTKELRVNTGGTAIEYITKSKNETTFSGSQALTTSYVTLSGCTFTTPNDGFTRTYLIFAEAVLSITNGATDNEAFIKLINSSDATDLKIVNPAQPNIASGQAAKLQGTVIYLGSIAPNKTVEIQVKRGANNTVTIIQGSLTLVEISRS